MMCASATTMRTFFFRIFPLICALSFSTLKHIASSKRPLPSILASEHLGVLLHDLMEYHFNSRFLSSLVLSTMRYTPRLAQYQAGYLRGPFPHSAQLETVLALEIFKDAGMHFRHVYQRTWLFPRTSDAPSESKWQWFRG
jgi:hypothetical protein